VNSLFGVVWLAFVLSAINAMFSVTLT